MRVRDFARPDMMSHMRIVSWNVNGLRALHRKGHFGFAFALEPDILFLQEVKAEAVQLPADVSSVPGYRSYFDHSKGRKGYSGVAAYVKEGIEPERVEFGIGVPELDAEGRSITLMYPTHIINTTYFPNGGGGPERLAFKLRYYDAFLPYIEKYRKEGKEVLFSGDVNTAHTEMDLAHPKENEENTGFLPVERAWIDRVIASGYTDVFRHFHPNVRGAYTYWDMKSYARERNIGWRLDYFFTSPALLVKIKKVRIHDDMFGSDHCPLSVDIEL
jgi:exodeoxyribonuclease III